jgi:hypothetical protein
MIVSLILEERRLCSATASSLLIEERSFTSIIKSGLNRT